MGRGERAHVVHRVWERGQKNVQGRALGLPEIIPFGGGERPGGGRCTWSSSLRRVIRWKGRIRKDLRERRWQTGSLSSFSRTSRKLLLLVLCGQRVRRDLERTGGPAAARGADTQGYVCGGGV